MKTIFHRRFNAHFNSLIFFFVCTATLCAPAGIAKSPTDDGIVVEHAWIRATAPNAPVAGGFVSLRNASNRADRLLSVTSPDAATVEIHESRLSDGMMRMRRLDDGIAIAPNASVTLKPGGYHLMFIGPKKQFAQGSTVTATLRFERAGKQTIKFEVRAMGSGGPSRH